ncbi:Fe-S-containing protein [Candidatus Bipolaricaulota bacterium]
MGKHGNVKGQSRDTDQRLYSGNEKAVVKSKRWRIFAAAGLLVAVAAFTIGATLMQTGAGPDAPPVADSEAPVPASHPPATIGHEAYPLVEADAEGTIRFPVATFEDGVTHYYTYMHGDRPIEFFVLQSADGVVRAAFNACDSCYRDLRGYSQDGQIMVCNNCGQQFPAEKINIVRGGCNPGPLDRVVEDTELTINAEDVIAGAMYF